MTSRSSLAVALGLLLAPAPVGAVEPGGQIIFHSPPVAHGKTIVLVAGGPSHEYGTHDHKSGALLLADRLVASGLPVQVAVSYPGWPADPAALSGAAAVVVYADGGGGHPVGAHLDEVAALAKKGLGLGFMHYATEIPAGKGADALVEWTGGYFDRDRSVNPHWTTENVTLAKHPITNGVRPYSINDEWYFAIQFAPGMAGVTPILSAVPPPGAMSRPDGPRSGTPAVRAAVARGDLQHLMWARQRKDGGRGFGFTGGHVSWNWAHPDHRRLILNAIAWIAKLNVPRGGVPSREVTLDELEKNADEPVPKDWNRAEIAALTNKFEESRYWKKHDINNGVGFEAAGVADFDHDGRLDVFSGDSWYQAPASRSGDWTRHKVRDVEPGCANGGNRRTCTWYQDFGDLPLDVNGDGRPDVVTCDIFRKRVGWIENPGDATKSWIEHEIDRPGGSETCRLVDFNGDGKPELFPATDNVIVFYELVQKKPEVKWEKRIVNTEGWGHGVGVGDVDGDGRLDIISPRGWYQQPADFRQTPWTFHADFNLGRASILIAGRDVDGDGLTDIVWGNGHDYGLLWLRQKKSGGKVEWVQQNIDTSGSQNHTVLWASLDGKSKPAALLTGKRIYAHEFDNGATDAPGIFAYRFDRKAGKWDKEVIYAGEPARAAPADIQQRRGLKDFPTGTAATGLQMEAIDLDRDGDLDVICPGKTGLYWFENLRGRK